MEEVGDHLACPRERRVDRMICSARWAYWSLSFISEEAGQFHGEEHSLAGRGSIPPRKTTIVSEV